MKKALIVEDDEYMIANLIELLELENFEVESVSNGQQVLDLACTFQPDVILSDMRLPGMDGFAILEAIRQEPCTAHIPFIFLTGRSDSLHMKTALDNGADGYLVKPFEVMDLLGLIERVLVQ